MARKLEIWHADKIKGITSANFAENYIYNPNYHQIILKKPKI